MDEFLTVREIAELLKVNPQTVRNWIDRRELPAVRVGARRVRDRQSDLDAFLTTAGATAGPEHGDEEAGHAIEAVESDTHDQFLGALTEILRTAANQDSHDMGSTLRELAAAAEALADTLEGEQDGS